MTRHDPELDHTKVLALPVATTCLLRDEPAVLVFLTYEGGGPRDVMAMKPSVAASLVGQITRALAQLATDPSEA